MKCNGCGCDNEDGAKFCRQCGMQLVDDKKLQTISEIPLAGIGNDEPTVPIEEDETTSPVEDDEEGEGETTLLTSELRTPGLVTPDNEEEKEDDSEANTTLLTSELRTPVMGVNPNSGSKPMPGAPMQSGMAPGAPMQPGMAPGAPMQPGMTPVPQDMSLDGSSKKDKKKAAKKNTKSGSNGTGKAYLIISIIVMVALAGAVATFFILHTNKINDLNDEVASLTDANKEYETQVADYGVQVADYESQIATFSATVQENAATIESLQEDIADYAASSDHYATYNGLIAYADANTGTSNQQFFASDTVLHMTTDPVEVYVYVSENTDLNYVIDDSSIASCEWTGWASDNVAILTVTPGGTIGNTMITLTKGGAQNAEEDSADETTEGEEAPPQDSITIFVYNN